MDDEWPSPSPHTLLAPPPPPTQIALAQGASVALLARREGVLRAAVEELVAATGVSPSRVTAHVADVTDEGSVGAAMAAAAAAHGGRIDVLINSAGAAEPRVFEETPAASWEAAWRLIVLGNRNAVAGALPFMPGGAARPVGGGAGDEGRVVLVSSQAGQTGLYGYSSYSVSRGGGWVGMGEGDGEAGGLRRGSRARRLASRHPSH